MVQGHEAVIGQGTISDLALLRDSCDLLAGIGNAESKAVLFGAMALKPLDHPFSVRDLHTLFLEVQGDGERAWPDIARLVPSRYAEASFEPIGAVTHSEVSTATGISTRYFVRRYGRERGLGAAGLLLDFSLAHEDLALYSILGQTGSKSKIGNRAPETRIKILATLMAADRRSLAVTDLVEENGISLGSVDAQLDALAAGGIVELARKERNVDDRHVTIPDTEAFLNLRFRPGASDVRRHLYGFLCQRIAANETRIPLEEALAHLIDAFPNLSRVRIVKFMDAAVGEWQRNSKVLNVETDFPDKELSRVSLTEAKRETVSDLLFIVDALMAGDEDVLERGKQRAGEIIANPQEVNTLIGKAMRASPYKQQEPREATMARLVGIFEPGTAWTLAALTEKLKKQGRPLSSASVGRFMAGLVADGRVDRQDINGKAYFTLADGGPPPEESPLA